MPPHDDDDTSRRSRRRDDDDDDYETDEEYEARRRRRRERRDAEDKEDVVAAIVPMNVSIYALISLYGGLIGFCLPGIGLIFAVPALVCGIIALKRWKKANSYGAATSNARAVIGTVLAGLGTVIGLVILGVVVFAAATGKK